MDSEAELEIERLKRIARQTPVWLKCVWTTISLFLAMLVFWSLVMNLLSLVRQDESANWAKPVLSMVGCMIAALLLGVARDFWMLPKVIEGRAKIWLL